MKAFLDSSALAKRYVEEKGSDDVQAILRDATSLGLAVLSIPEVISALCRRKRERLLSERQYVEATNSLLADAADAFVVNINEQVVSSCIRVLETSSLRAADAIHIACAIEWGAELFVSSDAKQLQTARHLGLEDRKV